MALIDPNILNRQPGSLIGAGLEGFNQGMQARDAMTQRQQAMQQQARQEGFRRNMRGLLGKYGDSIRTPEGQNGLVRDLARAGYGEEAMGLFGKMPEIQQAKPQEYGIYEGDQVYTYPKSDPSKMMAIPGVMPKSKGPTSFEIEKEKWERDYKERQLKASMGNTAKDNELAGAKFELTKAKTEAEMARKAVDVDESVAQADAAVSLIDQMIGSEDGAIKRHPGFKGAVGAKDASSLWGLKDKPLAGTDAAGFAALYDQVKGGAFLEAVQKMKGSGALSDTEGKAAANAITRMQTSTSEAEFERAAKEFRTAIKNRKGRVMERAAAKAPGLIVTPHAQDSTGWKQIAPGIRVREKP